MRKESINLRNYCSFKTFLNISRLQKYTKNVICLCGQMFSHVASHKMSLKCLIFIHFIRKVGWFSMQLFRWILDFSQLFLYFSIFLCSYALKNSCMNFDWNIFNNSKIALVFKFEMEIHANFRHFKEKHSNLNFVKSFIRKTFKFSNFFRHLIKFLAME